MNNHVADQSDASSSWSARYNSDTLQHIGRQVEALMSQHSSLQLHKRAIERHLTSLAAQLHEPDVPLTPRSVFLLLEMRGSASVSNSLEHIAHIVHEQGYWRPHEHVQDYHRQDVYQLGKSAQWLFDDSLALARRVEQLQARLQNIRQHRHLASETTPQQVFDALAADADLASVLDEVEAIVDLLERDGHPGWFRWLLLQSRSLASIMRCLV
jgi:hypothetical protein